MSVRLSTRPALMLVSLVMLVAACGGDASTDVAATPDATLDTEALQQDAEATAATLAENLTESLEGQQAAAGGGSATLTVGDQTWTFNGALCAFGEEMIGQEGAVFNLSSIQDGLQLYVSIDSFGHSITLNDIANFQDPSVDLEASGFSASMAGTSEEFVELDGGHVEATAPFIDDLTDSLDPIEGTLVADCP